MSDQILTVNQKVTLLTTNQKVNLLTAFRGEKGDPGDGISIAIHENSPTSHPDIRLALNSKATSYTHIQSTLSTTWAINHNLNKYPSVSTILGDGTKVEGSIIFNGYNVVSVTFGRAISGIAYCV